MTEIEKDQLLSTLDAIAETDGTELEATETANDGKGSSSPPQPSYRDVVATAKPKTAKKTAPAAPTGKKSEASTGAGSPPDDKAGTKDAGTVVAQPLKAFTSRKIKSWADEEDDDDDADLSPFGSQSTAGGDEKKIVAAAAETDVEQPK